MKSRCLAAGLALALASALVMPLAQADVYTWTDASGRINVSNIAPPAGVRVTNIVRENPESAARAEVAREAARQAELQALSQRVQQLEREADIARQMPPAYPTPPIVTNTFVTVQPPFSEQFDPTPPAPAGCGYGGLDCFFGSWPGFYPPSVVYASTPSFHRGRSMRGGRSNHPNHPPRGSAAAPVLGLQPSAVLGLQPSPVLGLHPPPAPGTRSPRRG